MKHKKQLKILLLQIREDKETLFEEFYEFVQFSGLKEEQFTVLNVFTTTKFDMSIMDSHDALFVGGSSDATVLKPEEYTFVIHCQELIRHCYENNIPVFASCFGFQLAVQELGGLIIIDQENMEMGTYKIHLNDKAKKDPLLYDFPETFYAVSGHKERALKLPEDTVVLGYSDLCPYHIIKFKDKPFYGFQFHPETDVKDLIARITRYENRYFNEAGMLQKFLQNVCEDVNLANSLVKKFIDRIILTQPSIEK